MRNAFALQLAGLGRGFLATPSCDSPLQRFIWDGDQLLAETRRSAGNADSDGTVETDSPDGNGASGALNAYGVVAV